MTRDDVRKEIDHLIELMRDEQKLRVELLSLEMVGPNAVVRKAAARHEEIIAAINDLRLGKIVPIFRKFARFIKARREAGTPAAS